ncbi:hypothetical protein [Jatrophihabitans sp.]|jgi:hypothetical protein|uniref:hypothetical protein n=1 Tax=Jatrophihabitans sp. TaxID=1932789 RepID=UPI002F020168
MARSGKRLGFLPGWRIFTYVILAFNLLMLIWIIGGISSANSSKDCGGLDADTCQAATDVGTGIAVFFIIVLWALGDIILGVLWLVTNRKRSRPCPACGTDVKNGTFECRKCGFDFRSALQQPHGQAQP